MPSSPSWTPQPECGLVLVDPRALAVCLVCPYADQFYNWATGGWEFPFAAAAHLKPLQAMEGPPSLFAPVQFLDVGPLPVRCPDCALLLVTIDGSGSPIAVVDCRTQPSPPPPGCAGSWPRG